MYDKTHYNIVISLQLIKINEKKHKKPQGRTQTANKSQAWAFTSSYSRKLPRWCSWWRICLPICRRHEFDPWVRKTPLEEEMAIHSKYSCLGSPKNRGAQWVAVRGVAKNQTRLSMYIHRQQKVQGSETGIASGVRGLRLSSSQCFYRNSLKPIRAQTSPLSNGSKKTWWTRLLWG